MPLHLSPSLLPTLSENGKHKTNEWPNEHCIEPIHSRNAVIFVKLNRMDYVLGGALKMKKGTQIV